MGTVEGKDKEEVIEAVLPYVPARGEEGSWDKTGCQARNVGANVRGAKFKEKSLLGLIVRVHHLTQSPMDGRRAQEGMKGGES